MPSLTLTSILPAAPDEVWRHATSLAGINAELSPWVRIDAPDDLHVLADLVARTARGESPPVCRLLGLGLVPVASWPVVIRELERNRFVEASEMEMLSLWRHERRVVPAANGAELTDVLTWEPRWPVVAAAAEAGVRTLFNHRHARLATMFAVPGYAGLAQT